MKVPWELYCNYQSVVKNFNSDDVYRYLKEASLILKYPKTNIDFRVKELQSRYLYARFKNISFVDWLKSENIYEPYAHFRIGIYNPVFDEVNFIFVHLVLRKLVDRGIILEKSTEDIVSAANNILNIKISAEAVDMYSKLAWSRNMTKLDWVLYLSENDVFGYKDLLSSQESISLFNAEFHGQANHSREYEFIAKKAFNKLESALNNDDIDPKTCTEWFKLFNAAKEKITVSEDSTVNTDINNDIKINCIDPESIFNNIKPIDDFVNLTPKKNE